MRRAILGLLLSTGVLAAPEGAPPDMKAAILAKLEYDLSYFQRILTLKKQGKVDAKMSRAEFDSEAVRAAANVPVLERTFKEKAEYARGKPLPLPGKEDVHRVYSNLITLLNMLQAAELGNPQGVVDAGRRVVIKDRKDLGLVRGEDARYYLNLYREYFYLMAVAYYRVGNDSEAVSWMARIEADADLQSLKKKIAAEGPKNVDSRAVRLELLATRPLAVMPLKNLEPDEETNWMGAGLAEVFTNDLLQYSDLIVLERAAIQAVLGEMKLVEAGITEPRVAQDLGKMLSAGSLVAGSYRRSDGKVWISLRLVDVDDGRALASAEGSAAEETLFEGARQVLLSLMTGVNWMGDATRGEILASRAPRPGTIRDLLAARLLLASKSDQAKALYAKAVKEDPAFARAFGDLKKEFSGLSAAVAVLPFVNTSGVAADLWMVQGVAESLTTDLPKLGFTVVERAQLARLLKDQMIGQVLDPDTVREFGMKVEADFVVLGSLLHQKPNVRVDMRFVDVRTGVVANSVSAEGLDGEFTKLLVSLSVEIAKRFNEKLSEATLSELAGKKMSLPEFERYAREQLAKETLARQVKPVDVEEAPSRVPFWGAVGGVAAGTGVAALGFVLGAQHGAQATYSDALLRFATQAPDIERLTGERDRESDLSTIWRSVGWGGVGMALVSVGYLVYQEIVQPPTTTTTIQPLAALVPGAVVLGLAGEF